MPTKATTSNATAGAEEPTSTSGIAALPDPGDRASQHDSANSSGATSQSTSASSSSSYCSQSSYAMTAFC